MCLADLYDFTPEQRASIARLESLRNMRQYVLEVRSAVRSDLFMPAAAADLPPSLTPGHAAAGNPMEQPA